MSALTPGRELQEEEYIEPEKITITQIYFDPDKRGESTLNDAENVLQELISKQRVPTNLSGYGDAFMLDSHYSDKTDLALKKLFGSGFTASVFRLEPRKWHGPVLSGYGTHLVFVHEHVKNNVPQLSEVRELVRADWMEKMKQELEQRYIDGLMARYEVIVEDNN